MGANRKGLYRLFSFLFKRKLEPFLALKWNTWEDDIKNLSGSDGFHVYTPLWTAEGEDMNMDSRKTVPFQEMYDFTIDVLLQFKKK